MDRPTSKAERKPSAAMTKIITSIMALEIEVSSEPIISKIISEISDEKSTSIVSGQSAVYSLVKSRTCWVVCTIFEPRRLTTSMDMVGAPLKRA